ncbi:MAG: hypothetical protein DSZ05_07545 [Sulfurospirillum sp.]|nr:MAG: hypothetical protein DSZ05_07545 [Sulfurospirillum sp.]
MRKIRGYVGFFILFTVLLSGCRHHSASSLPPESEQQQDSASDVASVDLKRPVQNVDLDEVPEIKIKRESIYSFSLHYPERLKGRYPLILFIPGWGSVQYEDYRTLIDYLVSLGNIVLFAPEYANEYGIQKIRQELEDIYRLCSIQEHMDTSRFGVVGHSSGGGKAFAVCRYFVQKGWGTKGRFIFSMAPWFAFDMGQEEMQSIPEDTYVFMEFFGSDMTTDPRISMTTYSLLTQIPAARKTFYVYPDTGHGYPTGNRTLSQMDGVTEPLRAVIDAAFYHRTDDFMEFDSLGSDTPWQAYREMVQPSGRYPSRCRPSSSEAVYRAVEAYDIDYCASFSAE